MSPRAVIAEDEPLLAASLRDELATLWPELAIVAMVGDGQSALEATLTHRPEVVFLDIRMPGMSGLETAQALAEDWPDSAGAFPLLVFVTAYDQYALEAFERAAVDYVLKPVQPARLAATCQRLRAGLAARAPGPGAAAAPLGEVVEQLRGLLGAIGLGGGAGLGGAGGPGGGAGVAGPMPDGGEPLRVLQIGVGNAIHMLPVDEVVYFEAADKYVRVVTATREHLIRTALRDLLPRLDAARFWQIHRGVVVRAEAIESALRDESGRVALKLRGRPEKLAVSRLYAHRFKAM